MLLNPTGYMQATNAISDADERLALSKVRLQCRLKEAGATVDVIKGLSRYPK